MELKSEVVSIRDLLELKKSSMLIVNSEYQRGAVWTESQQKKLIDSVMRGYPLPLIYLHHKIKHVAGMRSEGLEIIDGQQRINALHAFAEGAFKLFDPIKDDRQARFPNFIKNKPCPWSRSDFVSLDPTLKNRFLETSLNVVKITTEDEDEARDLFIRLQAGLPLNAQEKRDAWPGGLTQLVLQLGGKRGLTRFPGHDFFKNIVKVKSTDRGEIRQLCAQICMLVFERGESFADISSKDIDDYYYRNLDFDLEDPRVNRLTKTFDLAVQIFDGKHSPRLKSHEAIHIVLLLDSLRQDYDKSWIPKFQSAYDGFKQQAAIHKAARSGDYWFEYGALTQTQSDQGRTIQRRHSFFLKHMIGVLKPRLLDETRIFGEVEREIAYYRQSKKCAVCDGDLKWADMEIHHVVEHHKGGQTSIDNAAAVHKSCHPKGAQAAEFAKGWDAKRASYSTNGVTVALAE